MCTLLFIIWGGGGGGGAGISNVSQLEEFLDFFIVPYFSRKSKRSTMEIEGAAILVSTCGQKLGRVQNAPG